MSLTANLPLDLFFDLLLVALWTRIGWCLSRRFLGPLSVFNLLVSSALGFLGLAYFVFLIGVLGHLTRHVVEGVLCLLAAMSLIGFRPTRQAVSLLYRNTWNEWTLFEKTLFSLMAVASVFQLFFNYAPPTGDDELVYHLSLPQLYCFTGRFTETPSVLNGYFPLNAELVYTAVLLLRNALAVKTMVWLMGIFVLLALYTVARGQMKMTRTAALLACTLLTLSSFFTSLDGTTSSDFLTLFFEILSVGLLWSWKDIPLRSTLILMGVLAGAALGSRPYAVFGVFSIGVTLLVVSRNARAAFLFGSTALMVFSAWPLRNFLLTGNPFYPQALWPGAAESVYFKAMAHVWVHAPFFQYLLELPFFVSCSSFIWSLGPLPLSLAPWAYATAERSSTLWRLTLLAGLPLLIDGFLPAATGPRYCGQSFPWIVLLAGLGYDVLAVSLSSWAHRLIIGGIVGSLVVPNLCFAIYMGGKRIPFALGFESAQDYLKNNYAAEGFEMMQYLTHRTDPSGRLLFVGALPGTSGYYYPGRLFLSMATFAPEFYTPIASEFHRRLRQQNIRYVLFIPESFKHKEDGAWAFMELSPLKISVPDFSPPYFKPLEQTPRSSLYEVTP